MNSYRVYGASQKPQQPVRLSAGPLSLIYEGGDLRYIRMGEPELLRRIYVAVRDRNWRTIPGKISGLRIEQNDRSFAIGYTMQHLSDDGAIDFVWSARITGNADGQVDFEMAGQARSTFLTNRTGFCVLHPVAECAGKPCTIEHVDGTTQAGTFPLNISPHQPFVNIRAIRHSVNGVEARVLMNGEAFEMEDQRNWSDGSYKTYCRPLSKLLPYELKKGDVVTQSVRLELIDTGHLPIAASPTPPLPIELDLEPAAHGQRVPQIGLATGEDLSRLSPGSIAAIKGLSPQHLRLDIHLSRAGWDQSLRSDLPVLRSIGMPIEVAIHLPDAPAADALSHFASLWRQSGLQVARWLVLSSKGATKPRQLEQARAELSTVNPNALFAGGTDAEFVAINRIHPPSDADALCFSLNPQVHAFDNLSLIENLQSHGDMVQSARHLAHDRLVAITPITLRRRFNPDATAPDARANEQRLPPSVEVRQMSLFAAAWTVGCLSRLCHADFLTFFETHGWRGVIQGNADPALPGQFPARAGDIFPVYHALRSMLSFRAEQWHELPISRPLELAAILLHKPGQRRLLVANLLPGRQAIQLRLSTHGTLVVLDGDCVDAATRDPDFWLNAPSSVVNPNGHVELSDYAIAQLDWSIT